MYAFVIAGITHLWNMSDDVPEAAEEVTTCQEVDPRKKKILKNWCSDIEMVWLLCADG